VFVSVDPLVTATMEPYISGAANPATFSDPGGLRAPTGSNCPDGIPVVQNANLTIARGDGRSRTNEKGDRLALEADLLPFGLYTQGAPVEVIDVGSTGVRFEALYGHIEGGGRRISFRFVEWHGTTYLKVEARGSGSLVTKIPIVGAYNNSEAAKLWAQLAENLRVAAR
jgi:hypothetical protein